MEYPLPTTHHRILSQEVIKVTNKLKKAIMGIKVGMTQIFDENGRAIPVTVVEASPMWFYKRKQ